MVEESQIILFLLGIAILAFVLLHRLNLRRLPESEILIWAFYVLLTGWIFPILAELFWIEFFNLLEHVCYTGSAILVCIWCWKVFVKEKHH